MPGQQHASKPADREQQTAQIRKLVILALGQPGDLHRVQVRRLWDDHYRVNVLVGTDGLSTKIAHSYFLVTDGDGNISTATPTITRQY